MNFQIARIRLASVGPEPARYDPLDLHLTTADGAGPSDTVLYLPNTGGKTVLLRLLFSVLHPPVVEKIGTEEVTGRTKNLLGYVLERDTAHVVIEWRRAEAGRFVDDEVLLTGLVAEWRGGRVTGNPEDLVKLWYSIRGQAASIDASRLIFDVETTEAESVTRRRLSLRQYSEELKELGRGGRGAPTVTTTEIQREWVKHLDDLGLDRAIFRYQGAMNHNEAGASAIARFTKDLDFVAFFLNAVMDPGELATLDREFDEVADKVRRYPEYERRLRFEEAARTELEPLSVEVEAAQKARAEAEEARRASLLLLAAFAGGETEARGRERAHRERCRERDSEARKLSSGADRLRDEWREFRRTAAILWLDEATATYNAAEQRRAAADLDVRAWAVTDGLARWRDAEASVRALDAAYDAEMDRLRPLQDARDDAAKTLVQSLSARAALATAAAAEAKARVVDARKRAATKRTEERDALIEATKLEAVREEKERRLAAVAAHRARLVSKGHLDPTERAADAQARAAAHAEEAEARLLAIREEAQARESERADLDALDREAAPRIESVRSDRDRVRDALDAANAEYARLATNTLVRELAESQEFDLELVGPAIAERLLGRATEADNARVQLELRAASDRRALRGLDQTGLLPPPPEVDTALQRLHMAGIPGALAGTRYVADAIGVRERGGVLARRADLVGGIVLTDPADFPKAKSVLESAALAPAMIVSVGVAGELIEAASASGELRETFVVPPAAAIWDRTAASAERARREERIASIDTERAALDERMKDARAIADALTRCATAYPVGWRAARTAERNALTAELERLVGERNNREARRNEISVILGELRAEGESSQRIRREAELRERELARLTEEEAVTSSLAAEIERHRAEADDWRSTAKDAARGALTTEEEAAAAAQEAVDQRSAVERIVHERSQIALADPGPEPSLEEAGPLIERGVDLAELRVRFAELDRRIRQETSNSDVAARRAAAIRTRDELRTAFETQPANVRERAATLLARPEASELPGRRAAAERAEAEVQSAHSAEREAYAMRQRAQVELDVIEGEIRTSRRQARIPESRAPRDRHHAAQLAAEARMNADTTQAQAAEAERDALSARQLADEQEAFAKALGGLATQLRMGLNLPEGASLPSVSPYDGDVGAANTAGVQMSRRLRDAVATQDGAEDACRRRDAKVRALLSREEFADLAASDRLYRRLAQSPAEVLARDAGNLVLELRASIGILQNEIATLTEDVKLATTSLAKSVNKALSYLRLAETRSKMPASLRDWAGEPFLTVRFEKPPADQLEARLATFVADIVNRPASRPAGTVLLLQALERAVGQFSVRILKPNEGFSPIRVPVAELSSPTFSNGQRSTVATALMLMLSELRRQSRSSSHSAGVGALLLDNPFGNANAGFLIEVQRTVAAAAGIQLVYTTGIADHNALRRFPNVIALSNDAARRTMRKYVRTNPALLELLVPPNGEPGGRITASQVRKTRGSNGNGRQ